MQLAPRYDATPIIVMEGPVEGIGPALIRQRRRLVALLDGLDAEAWDAPSRCAGWRVRDVVSHLADTDGYWELSLRMGLAGEPTRLLDGFDPKATPAALVEAAGGATHTEVADRFRAASDGLLALVSGLDDAGWATLAEAPPGHLPARVVAHHALWDGWVHERDIALPLGLTPAEEPDEVLAALRYAAALGPAFAVSTTPGRRGTLVIEAQAPDATVVVEVDGAVRVGGGPAPAGAPVLAGPAVTLLEALSIRVPFPAELDRDDAWLLTGVAEVFESSAGPAAP
jgi:uncharacterized protein (TIGR03083 family)